jgi:hypothetical protein
VKKQTIIIVISLISILALLSPTGCERNYNPTAENSQGNSQSFEPITISGEGEAKSDPFQIPDRQWMVDWSYTSDTPDIAIFNVFIYLNRRIQYYVAEIKPSTKTSGSQEIHFGPGEYFIEIYPYNINSWKLTIRPV